MHSTTELTERPGADLPQGWRGGKRGSFPGMQALGLPFPDLDPAQDDVVEVSPVIEGADSNLAPGKGLVDGRLHGFLHVVEVDVYFATLDVPDDLKVMELAVLPGDAFLGEDEVLPGSMIDDEDLA